MDTRLLRPWDFLVKSTGVGCHFFLQGIFKTQGLNPGLPHCRHALPSKPPGKSLNMYKVILYIYIEHAAAAAAKSLPSCLTPCDPTDGSPPGSAVPRILQARTEEWVAISFSDAWKWKVKVKSLSHVWLFATPWTAAYQAPPSMGFSRQEYWSRLLLHN